jgi:hypothetical protein
VSVAGVVLFEVFGGNKVKAWFLGVVKEPTFLEVGSEDGVSVPLGKIVSDIGIFAFFYAMVGGAKEGSAEFFLV